MGNYVDIALMFIGGLGMFIYGMSVMAAGLQKSAGSRMKNLLALLTTNKFLGVLLGTAVTGIIQSSSATTVMVVGFVNAGLMNLNQAVGVIMGANIGTTVTSWIVSSVEWAEFLNPVRLAPLAIGIGAAMALFSSKDRDKHVGEIVVGFGILFVGMSTMSSAVSPLRDSPFFRQAFVTIGGNPLLGILAGAAVTGVIQSSSASVGILQSLALTGLVPWNAAVYIIMGQNIGTCVTALLSSIGASKNAKSAAYIHLIFNVIGTVIFSVVAIVYFKFINPAFGVNTIGITDISLVHTGFNLANTAMLYRFSGVLIAIAQRMANTGRPEPDEGETLHIDDRLLATPEFAIKGCIDELARMGAVAKLNIAEACGALIDLDREKADRVMAREKTIDKLATSITSYLVKLLNSQINGGERERITQLFHVVNDIERVGDHCENIAESAMEAMADGLTFTAGARGELKEISSHALESFENGVSALALNSRESALSTLEEEKAVDELEKKLRANHIERLANHECNALSGVLFIDTLSNLERISDHALNIAQIVLGRR